MQRPTSTPYPKPGPIGGRLIRRVIKFIRSQTCSHTHLQGAELQFPITSHILIALSGGSDSMGLAHLLVHFGRKIAPRSQITLLHINHGWRGEQSLGDENFVREAASRWGVPVIIKRIAPPEFGSGESWEENARKARRQIFDELAHEHQAIVFTAHQADDLAETLLWRLFTGAAETHGGGVAFRHSVQVRPFLTTRKNEIEAYLKEVGESFCHDSTNFSDRFLRAKMRSVLMPEIERLFPRAIEHLMNLALKAQTEVQQEIHREQGNLSLEAGVGPVRTEGRRVNSVPTFQYPSFHAGVDSEKKQNGLKEFVDTDDQRMSNDAVQMLIRAAGIKARRPHWEAIEKVIESERSFQSGRLTTEKLVKGKVETSWSGEIALPGGWRLTREVSLRRQDRWVLERKDSGGD